MIKSPSLSASASRVLQVDLGDRSYPIFIGSAELSRINLDTYIQGQKVLIVTNDTIAPLYLDLVVDGLSEKQVDVVVLPDGERFKNLDHLNLIFTTLLENQHDRKTTLIALGGGVVGDMAGYAAASYQRGVPFIQIPTTLLAQVDSSVGGKTGVNHELGKNMIGAFYQPRVVVVDLNILNTLPAKQFSAGMAEVIKYGLITDYDFLEWLEANAQMLLSRDENALSYAIEKSCINKAKVVAADETEQGVRAILNLGHTFGHAIETFQKYTGFLHGEAVAIGMLMAMEVSVLAGHLVDKDVQRVRRLLEVFSLPSRPPDNMTSTDFISLMYRDKKVLDGKLRLVLLRALGDAYVEDDSSQSWLKKVLISTCVA